VPMYDYACQKCDHHFEALVFDGDRVVCPVCAAEEVTRQVSLPAPGKVATTPLPTACRSEGPPCGPACSRWRN